MTSAWRASEMSALASPSIVMALVAAVLMLAATWVVTRPARTGPARYGRRIAATMLGAGALILGGFAAALSGWGAGR